MADLDLFVETHRFLQKHRSVFLPTVQEEDSSAVFEHHAPSSITAAGDAADGEEVVGGSHLFM